MQYSFGKAFYVLLAFLLFVTHSLTAQSEKKPVSELLFRIVRDQGVEEAIDKYQELKTRENQEYDLGEGQLNQLGYQLLNTGKSEEAVAIFELNARLNPESINVWDSLGEGYLSVGNKDAAIAHYNKVLEMLESDTTLPPQTKNFYRNNAESKIFEANHFETPARSELHYVSFFGGPAAGKWDMRNIAEFKDEHGIKLSYQGNNLYRSPVPNNIGATFSERHPANVSHSFIAGDYRRYIESGKMEDITALWDEKNWDVLFPDPFKRMATYRGKQYFVPMAYQWNPIWYREDIFEKHNLTPPESWEELLMLCDRLNELGYTPFTISVQNWPPPVARWFTTLNLRLNGPEFHNRVMRGDVPFTDDRIHNVFVHWRKFFRSNAFAENSYQNNYRVGLQDLISGKAVMYNLGEWIFEGLDPKHAAKLDFFPFPEMNQEVSSAEIVHTYGAFMTSDDDNPKASKALLKWLASVESQQSNAKANSRVVANEKVDQFIYSDIQKRIIQHIKNTEVLVPLFEFNTHPDFARKALPVFQEFWKEPEDIKAALNKLETARQKVFDE